MFLQPNLCPCSSGQMHWPSYTAANPHAKCAAVIPTARTAVPCSAC